MGRHRQINSLFLAASLSGCAVSGTGPTAHVPTPGYRCEVGQAFSSEKWAAAEISEDGTPRRVSWTWRRPLAGSLLRATVSGRAESAVTPDFQKSYASISWAFYIPDRKRKDRFRVELTTVTDRLRWPEAPFASDFSRGGDVSVVAPWPDLLAFAKGANRLEVAVRRSDWTIARQQEIDPADIVAAESGLAEVGAKLKRLTEDYRQSCTYMDDLEPNIILV